jgi:hypothetical protein
LELTGRAGGLKVCNALAETMLAAGYTLARDLEAAAIHAERAQTLDGGLARAWGRGAATARSPPPDPPGTGQSAKRHDANRASRFVLCCFEGITGE